MWCPLGLFCPPSLAKGPNEPESSSAVKGQRGLSEGPAPPRHMRHEIFPMRYSRSFQPISWNKLEGRTATGRQLR